MRLLVWVNCSDLAMTSLGMMMDVYVPWSSYAGWNGLWSSIPLWESEKKTHKSPIWAIYPALTTANIDIPTWHLISEPRHPLRHAGLGKPPQVLGRRTGRTGGTWAQLSEGWNKKSQPEQWVSNHKNLCGICTRMAQERAFVALVV